MGGDEGRGNIKKKGEEQELLTAVISILVSQN